MSEIEKIKTNLKAVKVIKINAILNKVKEWQNKTKFSFEEYEELLKYEQELKDYLKQLEFEENKIK